MQIKIIGAGPAGLYLSILLKRSGLGSNLTVFEQNAPDATFGFGIVFSNSALEFLKEDDPETHAAITPDLERWSNIKIVHRGETVTIDGVGFTAIGRLHLLQLLKQEARNVGVDICYNHTIGDLKELGEADLIVGADGINSLVRRSEEASFGTKIRHLTNRFAWFGTTKRFDALTQTFIESERGFFNAHHYRYSDKMSTFIVECDEKSFVNGDLGKLNEIDLKSAMEDVFADALDGHPLVSNRSIWRQFPVISNQRWSVGNKVILGDALHTAHYSIGSGARLAMEDVIALVRALKSEPKDVSGALECYEANRKPILEILVSAANSSAAWYGNFCRMMQLAPYEFAMSYLLRSGRMSSKTLKIQSPQFMSEVEFRRARQNPLTSAKE